MRVWIDQDLCTGDGLCVDHCDDVFMQLEDGIAYVKEAGRPLNDPGSSGSLARVPIRLVQRVIHAAEDCPGEGNFVESGTFHPRPVTDDGSTPLSQMFGDVWEWTRSAYLPYPGYRPLAGALGEYNGKFMCNQLVLRGGSCATPASHIRPTYRNFFPPDARWQFSGVRLAK